MRVGDLFSGIGGFALAAEWVGWQTAWFAEIEPYACRVLSHRFPGIPNYGDITRLRNPAPVDVLCGGFPCQDLSAAGKQAGLSGSRSGLWREYARVIGEVRPRWVVIENVPTLRKLGLGTVLHDLHALGYDAEWHCIPAAYVGAPHQRDRIWVVAYPNSLRAQVPIARDIPAKQIAWRAGPTSRANSRLPLAWTTEPDVGRVADGVPARVDRLRGLGNAIVPEVAYQIFRAIDCYQQLIVQWSVQVEEISWRADA